MAEDELLSKAYGELARGFKRLRNVHQARFRDRKSRESPESEGSGLSVPGGSGSGLSVPRLAQTTDLAAPVGGTPPSGLGTESPGFFEREFGIKSFDFPLTPEKFLTNPRSRAFGKCFPEYLISTLLRGRVRGGMCGNFWVADTTQRRGWRKVGVRQMKGILHMLERYNSRCNRLIHDCPTIQDFVKHVGPLSKFKWVRRDLITGSSLTWAKLRRFAREEHRRLPSVCGANHPPFSEEEKSQ